jgi:YVTN family beta-propeller protein
MAAAGEATAVPDMVLASIPVDNEPVSLTFDPENGNVYVTSFISNNVSVLHNTSLVGTVPVGAGPTSAAYDPVNGYVYVANENSNNVSVLNSTSKVVTSVPTGTQPSGVSSLEYKSVGDGRVYGLVFVSNYGSNSVFVYNGTVLQFAIGVGVGPRTIATVSLTDVAFALVPTIGSGNATWLQTSVDGGDTSFDNDPGLGFDPIYPVLSTDGTAWVANYLSNNVSVLSLGAQVATSIPVGLGPDCELYDPATGDVYVSDNSGANLSLVSTTSLLATIPVGSGPGCAALDSSSGEVFVPNHTSNNVTIINGTKVVGSVRVGTGPGQALYDPQNGYIYVTNVNSANVSVIGPPPRHTVTFTETGLPSGTNWSVSLNGTPLSSTTSMVAFSEPNGTYSFTVGSQVGYTATPSSGPVTVSGSPVGQTIAFVPTGARRYTATFTETGLPSGTNWSVTLNGTIQSSATGAITFSEPNGTISFSVGTVSGYSASPSSGSITVSGVGQSQAITFTALPPGTYPVTFTESGLPSGTSWTVSLNGTPLASTTTAVAFAEANGSYSFTISSVPGYTATPSTGVVTVSGHSVSQLIGFQSSSSKPPNNGTGSATFLGLPAAEGYALLGVIVAAVVVGAVVAVLLRRRRRFPPSVVVPPVQPGGARPPTPP